MVPLGLGMSLSPLSSSTLISPKPPLLSFSTSVSNFKLLSSPIKSPNKIWLQKKIRRGICRADFSQDAPLAAALGACVLSSLIFPVIDRPDEDDGSAMDSTDARFAVMGIISFIPYFNWLSWVFAWLDTGRRRYAVYSLVYLAPYLRSNLSISPEESWLPITSIVLCIIHIQLEASIRNGDLQGFQLFGDAAKHLSSTSRKRETHLDRHQEREEHMNLPSADQQSRDDIERWGVPRKPADHHEQSNGDWNDDERGEQ